MLVLSRRQGEKIVIDGQITIVISQVKGNCVRLAIEAPLEVPILRGELPPRLERVSQSKSQPRRSSASQKT